jgi:hypothetical protein
VIRIFVTYASDAWCTKTIMKMMMIFLERTYTISVYRILHAGKPRWLLTGA